MAPHTSHISLAKTKRWGGGCGTACPVTAKIRSILFLGIFPRSWQALNGWDWGHLVHDTEALTGKRGRGSRERGDLRGGEKRRGQETWRRKVTGLARDHLGDGGYLRRSRSSQSTGCGLLDLGDACEYEKWVAGGVGWFVYWGGKGKSIYVYICMYTYEEEQET